MYNPLRSKSRSMIAKRVYADIGYYRSQYKNFLGYVIGIKSDLLHHSTLLFQRHIIHRCTGTLPNSASTVITEGWSAGLNWFVSPYITLSGNYSFNVLRKTVEDDPIIPAYPIHLSINTILEHHSMRSI